MKVLFLKDVPRIGRKNEVKEVADGFAYNNLIPRKLAVPATTEHVKRVETERAFSLKAKEEREKIIRSFFKAVAEKPLVLQVATNEKGHLFKGVHVVDILALIKEQAGVVFEEKEVLLPSPIKEVGAHRIAIHAEGVKGECVVSIEKK